MLAKAEDAVARIQNGDVIVLSGGASEPRLFLEALGRRHDLRRVTLISSLTLLPPDFLVRQYMARRQGEAPDRSLRYCTFHVGPGAREGAAAGVVDVIPLNTAEAGRLLQERRIDVVVVGTSGMDEEGNFNLACNVDWMPDILAAAEQSDALVIAEVNRSLPRTEGETSFRIEIVDMVIESDRPPFDLPAGIVRPEAANVGGLLAALVPDEATLQIGLGDLVSQASACLDGKRDLGVHSDFLGDVLLHLHERGALTCAKKGFMDGRWVGSTLLGSTKLYGFANRNPLLSLHPLDVVAQPATIARNRKMVSITQAVQVDVLGQIAGQSSSFEFLTNEGVQHAFHKAASASAGGMGIVVLPSTSKGGAESCVVAALAPGTRVSIPAADADCVVTEFGVARLRGKSLGERILNLIAVAHPDHRDGLVREARRMGAI
jgi:acyl-CoA hydrolase